MTVHNFSHLHSETPNTLNCYLLFADLRGWVNLSGCAQFTALPATFPYPVKIRPTKLSSRCEMPETESIPSTARVPSEPVSVRETRIDPPHEFARAPAEMSPEHE